MGRAPEPPRPDSEETRRLLERLTESGDTAAASELYRRSRPALLRFIELRFTSALRARLDPSDVVQETQVELARRMGDFLDRRPMPFHLWALKTAHEQLLKARRNHQAGKRDVARESEACDPASRALSRSLVDPGPSPSEAAAAAETAQRVARALGGLAEADREILLLRHVEGLSHEEVGCVLGLETATARKRYGRALFRLQKVLAAAGVVGGGDERT